MYNLFLDDERYPGDDDTNYTDNKGKPCACIIARNYDDFVFYIQRHGIPHYISFDHDLGEGKTGLDCAKYFGEYLMDRERNPQFTWYVHSQNPIGAKEIDAYLCNMFKQYYNKPRPVRDIINLRSNSEETTGETIQTTD